MPIGSYPIGAQPQGAAPRRVVIVSMVTMLSSLGRLVTVPRHLRSVSDDSFERRVVVAPEATRIVGE